VHIALVLVQHAVSVEEQGRTPIRDWSAVGHAANIVIARRGAISKNADVRATLAHSARVGLPSPRFATEMSRNCPPLPRPSSP
jgi:hypothetical protein